jgi:uncharacterized membrane protein (UPF0127 family)
MKNKKIILKHKKKKYYLEVGECNFLEKILGLMIFRKKALLLFNSKKPIKLKIHSFFCSPFLAVYTDDKNNVLEIIHIKNWKPIILPKNKFNKLIEIPLTSKYSQATRQLLK